MVAGWLVSCVARCASELSVSSVGQRHRLTSTHRRPGLPGWQVYAEGGEAFDPGLYVCGWLKRGPSGGHILAAGRRLPSQRTSCSPGSGRSSHCLLGV